MIELLLENQDKKNFCYEDQMKVKMFVNSTPIPLSFSPEPNQIELYKTKEV